MRDMGRGLITDDWIDDQPNTGLSRAPRFLIENGEIAYPLAN